jgi:mannose/cellobiose epimerase-like protein (N-acyl-D-glucosamine 2-epimerase family)
MYFEDKEKGGLFHSVSEDWSHTLNTEKRAEEQFTAARTSVIGAMITHDPEAIKEGEEAVDQVIERFEDSEHGGFFRVADKDWTIIQSEKSLHETSEIFGVLMHLYEVNVKDKYLEKGLEFLDTALEHAWDTEHGGFFSLYTDDWKTALDTKDLGTQCSMLQHLNGSWKDGMDSPYGPKSAYHRKRAEEFGKLILDKAEDKVHGGLYTSFTRDWKPAVKDKDVSQLASLALTLYFHYHNMGPSVWGPRRGSHAFTGRPYPAVYTYRGPAPCTEPVSMEAYRFGKTVLDIGDLLVEHAWDSEHGGFYTSLSENLRPQDEAKQISTQIACLLGLNVAYRLTGFKRFQERLADAVKTIEERCFDPENAGTYFSFSRDWVPTVREKVCGPNLMVGGIMSMVGPVADGLDVTRETLSLWLDPHVQDISRGSSAQFTVTVQNQGFEQEKVRLGGLSSPSRWLEPADTTFDLAPHECISYTLSVTPPEEMPEGEYYIEITCMREGTVGDYVSQGGKIIIK